MSGPKVLTLDIETSPNLAHVWSLWKQNVSLSQLMQSGQVICFAAKWHDKPKVTFRSDHHDGHDEMVRHAHRLIDEADVVVHYNGLAFDMPHLRREFLLAELAPPSPVQEIDLLKVVQKHFRFTSNKLAHVTEQLGLTGKLSHSGHQLWVDCMNGDQKAWDTMRRYNKQDVVTTEELYDRLLPWITGHPHVGLYDGETYCCRNCGSKDVQKRGFRYTAYSKYQQVQCNKCGSWSRHTARELGVKVG